MPVAQPVALVAAAPSTPASPNASSPHPGPASHSATVASAMSDKYALVNGTCPFTALGQGLEADRAGPAEQRPSGAGHRYGSMYCDILTPLRSSPRKLRVLEVGFGCDGAGIGGRRARLIKSFLKDERGPDVLLWDVDHAESGGDEAGVRKCLDRFHTEHPGVVEGIFLGDQANTTFLGEVIAATGGESLSTRPPPRLRHCLL